MLSNESVVAATRMLQKRRNGDLGTARCSGHVADATRTLPATKITLTTEISRVEAMQAMQQMHTSNLSDEATLGGNPKLPY